MNNNNYNLSHLPTFPFKIPFPPPIEENELKPSLKKGKLPVRATNQFLLYRTAVIKTLRENGVQDINMRTISKMASDLWNMEPEFVQQEYKSLALKAKGLHQKTAKYLTSSQLKETLSNRPLAPIPELRNSSENHQNYETPNDVISNINTKDTQFDTAECKISAGISYSNIPNLHNNKMFEISDSVTPDIYNGICDSEITTIPDVYIAQNNNIIYQGEPTAYYDAVFQQEYTNNYIQAGPGNYLLINHPNNGYFDYY